VTILSNPRFLAVYSGVLTVAFSATVFFGLTHGTVFASAGKDDRRADFDQITVHRINVVEADGTTRLVIANTTEYPGGFFKGKEVSRPDRKGEAGFLFMNNEGTENGGLIFGGYKDSGGAVHSWGHLSFDEYEQDQTMNLEMQQDGTARNAGYEINDNGSGLITPEVLAAFSKAKALPVDTPEQRAAAQKVFDELLAKYPIQTIQRAYLGRDRDTSAALHLRDAAGHDRILLRVAPDGTPQMQFLDASGKATYQWPQK
jgi:hypothetical protein